MITYYKDDGFYWIRFKYLGAIVAKDLTKNGMIFSERQRLVKFIVIGKWLVKVVK